MGQAKKNSKAISNNFETFVQDTYYLLADNKKATFSILLTLFLIISTALGINLVSLKKLNPFQSKAEETVDHSNDNKFGFSQSRGQGEIIRGSLHLNSAPLFSYNTNAEKGGNIHTFRPCIDPKSKKTATGTDEKTCYDLDNKKIKNGDGLKKYIKGFNNHYWTFYNEPNQKKDGFFGDQYNAENSVITPSQYAELHKAYYDVLEEVRKEEAAKGINFNYNLIFSGVGAHELYKEGFNNEKRYIREAIEVYQQEYKTKMPVDVFTFHIYPTGIDSCENEQERDNGINFMKNQLDDFVKFIGTSGYETKDDEVIIYGINGLTRFSEGYPNTGKMIQPEIWLTEWGWAYNFAEQAYALSWQTNGNPKMRANSAVTEQVNTPCIGIFIKDFVDYLKNKPEISKSFYFPLGFEEDKWATCHYSKNKITQDKISANNWHCLSGWINDALTSSQFKPSQTACAYTCAVHGIKTGTVGGCVCSKVFASQPLSVQLKSDPQDNLIQAKSTIELTAQVSGSNLSKLEIYVSRVEDGGANPTSYPYKDCPLGISKNWCKIANILIPAKNANIQTTYSFNWKPQNPGKYYITANLYSFDEVNVGRCSSNPWCKSVGQNSCQADSSGNLCIECVPYFNGGCGSNSNYLKKEVYLPITPSPLVRLVTPTVTPKPSSTIVKIRAWGQQYKGNPVIALYDGTKYLAQYTVTATSKTSAQIFTYTFPSGKTFTAKPVAKFTNDAYGGPGYDRNVYIDYIEVNGLKYESEDNKTYSEGSWTKSNGCSGGNKQQELLACNGFFKYNVDKSSLTTTITLIPEKRFSGGYKEGEFVDIVFKASGDTGAGSIHTAVWPGYANENEAKKMSSGNYKGFSFAGGTRTGIKVPFYLEYLAEDSNKNLEATHKLSIPASSIR